VRQSRSCLRGSTTRVAKMLIVAATVVQTVQAQTSEWSTPINISSGHPRPEYPAMALGQDGNIFVVWDEQNQIPVGLNSQIFLCSYDGHEWGTPVALCDTGTTNWSPGIAVDSFGHPHVIWVGGPRDDMHTWYRRFDGLEWSTPQVILPGANWPRLGFDREGILHLVGTTGYGAVYYQHDVTGWSFPTSISDPLWEGLFPRIAIKSTDSVHTTFFAYDTIAVPVAYTQVYYREHDMQGWHPIVRITNDSSYHDFPDIVVDTAGSPVIVWSQTFSPYPTRKLMLSTRVGQTWSVPLAITDSTEATHPSIAIDKTGTTHLVWSVVTQHVSQSRVMYSRNSGSGWTKPVDLSADVPFAQNGLPGIQTDLDGTCHVIWLASADSGSLGSASIYYTRRTRTTDYVAASTSVPQRTVLLQSYPNPFNPRTRIRYAISVRCRVVLSVYNSLGQQVRVLVDDAMSAGYHEAIFDGSRLSSGLYLCRLQAGGVMQTIKLLLLQ